MHVTNDSGDVCDLASTLCLYDLKKGNLFVQLRICGDRLRSILLLPLVARCLETIYMCVWCMFVFIFVVVTVWGLWECWLCIGRC